MLVSKYKYLFILYFYYKPPSFIQVKPLIWIESIIEKFSHSRVEIMVKVHTNSSFDVF